MFQSICFAINVLYRLISPVLADVFAGELVLSSNSSLERHRVVHIVNVFLGPVPKVANESVEVVALWHVDRTILIIFADFVHQQKGHVLVIDIENEGWPGLIDQLWQFSVH